MVLVRAASSSRGAAGRRHRPELTDVGPDGIVVRLSSLCSADLSHTSQLRLMPELTPDAIRNATLTRRLRGFDRAETEELLARVAESYGKLYAARTHLSEEVASLQGERQEREARSRAELDKLNKQIGERDRQIADLEAQIARFEGEQSRQLEDLARLREELSNVRTVQEELQADSREQGERVARFALREKALVAQMAMLASQLKEEEATQEI